MALRVYNTLTQTKEPFETVHPGKVGMYVCGPTVYSESHIGHMVGPVIFDTIKRYLVYLGYEATWVVNITDVDDKLIVQAQKDGTTVGELAERVTRDYLDCLAALGVDGIDHMPRATEHIGEIIAINQALIDKGFAYESGGDVYFDVGKAAEYGKLSHRDPEELLAGARIEPSVLKHHPGDFALWKRSKPGEPSWQSPWGPGRPGWHIECSAMSMKYLGRHFDIHGGGLDLVFPHHENELVQSESYSGETFATYWMHNGLLTKQGKKISKSDPGTIVLMSDLLKVHSADTLRALLLSSHYRRPIDFGPDRLDEIDRGLQTFYRAFERFTELTGERFDQLAAPTRRAEFRRRRLAVAQGDRRTSRPVPGRDGRRLQYRRGHRRAVRGCACPESIWQPAKARSGVAARRPARRLSRGHGRAQRVEPDPGAFPAARRRRPTCGRRADGSLAESLDRSPRPAPQGEKLRPGRRNPQPAHRARRDPGRPPRQHALADRAPALARGAMTK